MFRCYCFPFIFSFNFFFLFYFLYFTFEGGRPQQGGEHAPPLCLPVLPPGQDPDHSEAAAVQRGQHRQAEQDRRHTLQPGRQVQQERLAYVQTYVTVRVCICVCVFAGEG